MRDTTNTQSGDQSPGTDASVGTVRFRRDQRSSGISRSGRLQHGGLLRIEYDPARLVSEQDLVTTNTDIIAHARFLPGGEVRSGSMQAGVAVRASATIRPVSVEMHIPNRTSAVELWFERRGPQGVLGWDSRYGQNFHFPLATDGLPVPEQSVLPRPNAVVDPRRVRVVEDAASKDQAKVGGSGSTLQTELSIQAQIAATGSVVAVWADIHVLEATGELIHSGTLDLNEPDAVAPDTGMLWWNAHVYRGSGGGSGVGVWSLPDAHFVQYRLYAQIGDEVFTDGVLHEFEVPADAEIRPIPGGW